MVNFPYNSMAYVYIRVGAGNRTIGGKLEYYPQQYASMVTITYIHTYIVTII
jgi:hypothetical protein